MVRRQFDFPQHVIKLAWEKAKAVPGRDPRRWRFDAVGWPVLQPLRSRFRGMYCYQFDHKVALKTVEEKVNRFFGSIHNCQILSTCVNKGKSNRNLSLEDLKQYQFVMKPTTGTMDLAEIIHWGNIVNEDGIITRLCFTCYEINKASMFRRKIAACTIPSETDLREIFLDESTHKSNNFQNIDKNELKKYLGLDADLPVVLLKQWPGGMMEKIIEAVGDSLFDHALEKPMGQVVVIGGNNSLHSYLYQIKSKVPVQVIGDDIQLEKWIEISNCIITTVEPEIVSEALSRGMLVVLGEVLPEQGLGDMSHALANGMAVRSESPEHCAEVVGQWLTFQRRVGSIGID